MKVVICGPIDFNDYEVVCQAIEKSGFEITEVVSGGAKGADTLGERWSREQLRKEPKVSKAKWSDLKQEGAVIKKNKWGSYNSNAGFFRNEEMAKYCDGVIAIDTGSAGTGHMIKMAKQYGKELYRYNVEDNMEDEDYGYHF